MMMCVEYFLNSTKVSIVGRTEKITYGVSRGCRGRAAAGASTAARLTGAPAIYEHQKQGCLMISNRGVSRLTGAPATASLAPSLQCRRVE